MLADMLATLGQYPNYQSQYGTDTDIVIDNQIADANWGTVRRSGVLGDHEGGRARAHHLLPGDGQGVCGGLNFGGSSPR
jgi:hypothetical protein